MSENNTRKQINTYTSTGFTSYDRQFSALTGKFVNSNGLLSLALIFDEFVGKEPKSGDSVYDYENNVNFSIDVNGAISIKQAIEDLIANELKSISVKFGHGNSLREFTIFSPNAITLAKKKYDNYIIRLVTNRDGELKNYHILDVMNYKRSDWEGNEEEIEVQVGLNKIVDFMSAIISNASSVATHAIRHQNALSGGNKSSSNASKPSRRVIEEGDDEGDDDFRNRPENQLPDEFDRPAPKRAGTKPTPKKRDLSALHDDDDTAF